VKIVEVVNVISSNLSATTDKKAITVNEDEFSEQLMKCFIINNEGTPQKLEHEKSSTAESEELIDSLEGTEEDELEVFALINPFISFDNQTELIPVEMGISEISSDTESIVSEDWISEVTKESEQDSVETTVKASDVKVETVPELEVVTHLKEVPNGELEFKQDVEVDSPEITQTGQTSMDSPSVKGSIDVNTSSHIVELNTEAEQSKETGLSFESVDLKGFENKGVIQTETVKPPIIEMDVQIEIENSQATSTSQTVETETSFDFYNHQRILSQVMTVDNPVDQTVDHLTSPLSVEEEESLSPLASIISSKSQVTAPTVSTQVPTTSQPVVTLEESIDQIEQLLIQRVQNDKGTEVIQSTIRLTPESLGEIEIEIVVDKEKISGKFIFKTEEAKRYVESQLNQLRTPLEAKGIKFNSIEMTVKEQPQNQSQDMTFSQNFNQSKGEKQTATHSRQINTEEVAEPILETIQQQSYTRESGLNVYA